jgi:outer membrane immunogenic protein
MWVVGVETDLQLSSYGGTAIASPVPNFPLVPFTTTLEQKNDWFGTFRARAGLLATANLLVYGTGGLAYGKTETSFSTIASGSSFGTCRADLTCTVGSSSANRAGWAAGGGLEWMFAPHWTLRGEYLFVDLGTQSVSVPSANWAGPANGFTAATVFHENITRAAINYGF